MMTKTATTTVTAPKFNSTFPRSPLNSISDVSASDPIISAASIDSNASNIASSVSPFSTSTSLATVTSYSTLTNRITVYAQTTSVALDPADPTSSNTHAYYYALSNGTTTWIDGRAPPSNHRTYVTSTVQVTIYPTAAAPERTVTVSQVSTAARATITVGVTSGAYVNPTSTSVVTSTFTTQIVSVSTLYMTQSPPVPGVEGASSPNVTFGIVSAAATSLAGISTVTGRPVTTTISLAFAHPPTSASDQSSSRLDPADPPLGLTVTAQSDVANFIFGSASRSVTDGVDTTGAGYGVLPATGVAVDPLLASQQSQSYSGTLPGPLPNTTGHVSVPTILGNSTASTSTSVSRVANSPVTTSVVNITQTGYEMPSPNATSSLTKNTSEGSTANAGPAFGASYTTSPLSLFTRSNGDVGSVSAHTAASSTIVAATSLIPSLSTNANVSTAVSRGSTDHTREANSTSYSKFASFSGASGPSLTFRNASTLTTVPSTTGSSSVMPTPSVCGEHGDFVLTWDDEPTFSPMEPITDPNDAPPVFNPYHHLYFANGYVYIPPPSDPFPPVSEPRLVMFLTNETGPSDNPGAGGEHVGEIGAGDRASQSAFWFNAYSAYLGCDNAGPEDCTVQVSGYVFQGSGKEVMAYQQNFTLPGCPGFDNCRLKHVFFPKSMVGLSGLQFQASVNGEHRVFFMDNLSLGWYNNTCAAGLMRTRSK
ncbi:hypothetical protein AAFC00_005363 [Neodothiora populina]|uniref:DUF7371 domain-containing protein n=1 Tax=Neodothiora populina TaxID=2781224 RepID=A0ABR3PKM7_9PEZI